MTLILFRIESAGKRMGAGVINAMQTVCTYWPYSRGSSPA